MQRCKVARASFDTVASLPTQDDGVLWAAKAFVMLSSAPFARVSKHARSFSHP